MGRIVGRDMKNLLRWLNLNFLKANPRKLPLMILGKSLRPKYCTAIGKVNVKESNHVELLAITIDKRLSFKKQIENLCRNLCLITNCMLL